MNESDDWTLRYPALGAIYAEAHPQRYARLKERRCGAHSRSSGMPCKAKALKNGRCRFHGGLSTGPRTEAGKRAALANLRQLRK